jgi:hypothetical protein
VRLVRHALLTLVTAWVLALVAGPGTLALAATPCKPPAASTKQATSHQLRKHHRRVRKAHHPKSKWSHKSSCQRTPKLAANQLPANPLPSPAGPIPANPLSPPAPPAGAQAGTAPVAPAAPQLFAPTSFWNALLPADAPLDPNSGTLVDQLDQIVQNDESLNRGPWINTTKWSTPIYRVPAGQSTVRVQLDKINPALQAAFDAVPLPSNAIPAAGTDECLVVWQASTDRMWEFWQLHRVLGTWHASWGGEMDSVSTNPGRYANSWGATASSLPLIGGVITANELRAGSIDHALVMGLPVTRANWFAWPAARTDGRSLSPDAIPVGTRFRLDPTVDVDALPVPPVTKILAHAAQQYGLVVRGTSGNTALYAEDPTPTGSDPYPALFGGLSPKQIMSAFPWNRLQVLSAPLTFQVG